MHKIIVNNYRWADQYSSVLLQHVHFIHAHYVESKILPYILKMPYFESVRLELERFLIKFINEQLINASKKEKHTALHDTSDLDSFSLALCQIDALVAYCNDNNECLLEQSYFPELQLAVLLHMLTAVKNQLSYSGIHNSKSQLLKLSCIINTANESQLKGARMQHSLFQDEILCIAQNVAKDQLSGNTHNPKLQLSELFTIVQTMIQGQKRYISNIYEPIITGNPEIGNVERANHLMLIQMNRLIKLSDIFNRILQVHNYTPLQEALHLEHEVVTYFWSCQAQLKGFVESVAAQHNYVCSYNNSILSTKYYQKCHTLLAKSAEIKKRWDTVSQEVPSRFEIYDRLNIFLQLSEDIRKVAVQMVEPLKQTNTPPLLTFFTVDLYQIHERHNIFQSNIQRLVQMITQSRSHSETKAGPQAAYACVSSM